MFITCKYTLFSHLSFSNLTHLDNTGHYSRLVTFQSLFSHRHYHTITNLLYPSFIELGSALYKMIIVIILRVRYYCKSRLRRPIHVPLYSMIRGHDTSALEQFSSRAVSLDSIV